MTCFLEAKTHSLSGFCSFSQRGPQTYRQYMFGDLCAAVGGLPRCRDSAHRIVRSTASGRVSSDSKGPRKPVVRIGRCDPHAAEYITRRQSSGDPAFHRALAGAPFCGECLFGQQRLFVTFNTSAARHGALFRRPDVGPRASPSTGKPDASERALVEMAADRPGRQVEMRGNLGHGQDIVVSLCHGQEIGPWPSLPKFPWDVCFRETVTPV